MEINNFCRIMRKPIFQHVMSTIISISLIHATFENQLPTIVVHIHLMQVEVSEKVYLIHSKLSSFKTFQELMQISHCTTSNKFFRYRDFWQIFSNSHEILFLSLSYYQLRTILVDLSHIAWIRVNRLLKFHQSYHSQHRFPTSTTLYPKIRKIKSIMLVFSCSVCIIWAKWSTFLDNYSRSLT